MSDTDITSQLVDEPQDDAIGAPVMLPPSTPIYDALVALRDAGALTAADFTALSEPVPAGVWTLGDLVVVVARGEITDKRLATKLKKVLG